MDSKRPDPPEDRPTPASLSHPVSPPLKRRRLADPEPAPQQAPVVEGEKPAAAARFPSPFKLTRIRDLPPALNRDCIALKDLLGDPLISECWQFNYLHDIDFLLAALDEDVRRLVKVHIVHGFWKREDPSRLALQDAASRHANVTLHAAFMPEMFGTHHSKMMVLFRHDDTAQVVIHTANMILRDWTNMTQAAWVSPRMPLLPSAAGGREGSADAEMGSGERFKADLLRYLRSYDARRPTCKALADRLVRYDFSAVRGALVASVPGRHHLEDAAGLFGWPALEQALRSVPVSPGPAEIAIQVSSIATLGPTDAWLRGTFFNALAKGRGPSGTAPNGSSTSPPPPPPQQQQPPQPQAQAQPKPTLKVIFPTADEIRRSLDGYTSGGSIHTKISSPQQARQLAYLRPLFCHWANDSGLSDDGTVAGGSASAGGVSHDAKELDAGRRRAAPHIKTYIRFAGQDNGGSGAPRTIDWALLTSANLSKQAWGEAVTSAGEVRVASYEIGVLVWPGLYGEGATMRPTFQTDWPDEKAEDEHEADGGENKAAVVALRMPYSLPLRPYGKTEVPWVATMSHHEPDWMGQVWNV
ncbi:hypothetical protein VTJ83DRAFT_4243 [Remersonia thermophila]|uniref:Tyrosyl-DNA phosphodiesterase n=1 Tax=Remersonia thermophila TaxID=72144 RepID=A0ABR4D9D6_9PEZI